MNRHSAQVSLAVLGIVALLGLGSTAASADTSPAPGCISSCSATFSTVGQQTFSVPVGAVNLAVSVAGGAGADASNMTDPSAVGGTGGAARIALGDAYSGAGLRFGVGGPGMGSYLQAAGGALIAVAGGGGGGGFAGYLNYPDQVLAALPGGAGGSPTAEGVTPGADGVAFGNLGFQGKGGAAAGGAAGVGLFSGAAGASSTVANAGAVSLASGGAGGAALGSVAGAGGSGYTGGGGGAVEDDVPNGDVPVGVVGSGGGGSAYLAHGFAASALARNSGSGYVTFSWSFAPKVGSGASQVEPGGSIPLSLTGLPANQAFEVRLGSTIVFRGVSDANGEFNGSFEVPEHLKSGHVKMQIIVAGKAVGAPLSITITAAKMDKGEPRPTDKPDERGKSGELADTGTESADLIGAAGIALLALGAAALTLRTARRTRMR